MITSVTVNGNLERTNEYNIVPNIENTFDNGILTLPFSAQATRYESFSLVDALVEGIHEYWYVDSDVANPVDKETKNFHEHKIALIELTKILERSPMPNRAFVQLQPTVDDPSPTQLTALDVVNNIIETVPFRDTTNLTSGKLIDSIDSTLATLLDSIEIPDLFLSTRTMYEAFAELFDLAGINALPKLTFDGNDFILNAKFFNELQNLVDRFQNNYFEQEQQNTSRYASSLNITGSNQVFSFKKGQSFVKEPTEDWLIPRSDGNLLILTEAFQELGDDIEQLNQVEALITWEDDNVPQTRIYDITDWVLEEEVRKNKDVIDDINTDTPNQYNTVQYKLGDNKITNLYQEFNTDFFGTSIVIFKLFESVILRTAEEEGDSIVITDISIDPPNVRFRVSYVADIDAVQEVDKLDLTDTNTTSTLIIGQGDNFISSDRVLDSALSRANRSGNKDATTKAFGLTSISQIRSIGDFTAQGFILTGFERIAFPEHFDVIYSWSKDYQRISDFVGLDSEPRRYQTSRTLERNEIYKDYCILDTIDVPNDSYVGSFGVNVFANTFDNTPSTLKDKPVYAVAFQSVDVPNLVPANAIVRPVVSYAGGNALCFWFGFDNFKTAGKQLVEEATSPISFYNKTVNYTDDVGRLTDFSCLYVNSYASDSEDLPIISNPTNEIIFSTANLRTRKNQAEILSLTYQIMVLPSQTRVQDFIVGEQLLKNNNLINFKDGSFDSLRIFTSTERYRLGDNKKAKGTETSLPFFVDIDEPFIELNNPIGSSGTPLNWALGNTDGELYLAVNQIKYDGSFENIDKIFFNFVQERF